MAYNNMISRANAEVLIPEPISREILQDVPRSSIVLSYGRRLPNMTSQTQKMPVLSGLITANFVTGDIGLKQTAELAWADKSIVAEELAVIVPIPENVLDDADYDIWGEVRPRIVEAFGRAIDGAVLFDDNAPATWPDGIMVGATAAGNVVTHQADASADLFDEIFGIDGVIAVVEEDGYMVNGHVSAFQLRAKLRAMRTQDGLPIFMRTPQAAAQYELDGVPTDFPRNGVMDHTRALLFSGDWNQLVYSIRQDVTYRILDQAVIQDATGAIVYNLAQQDMIALRVKMRLGWQLPNITNLVNPDDETRYPFGVLLAASEAGG